MRCDSRAHHLKAWSNQPSWKISLSTQKTNPTSPLVGLPEAQKLGCRLGTSPRAGSKTAKSTGKLGSFVFLCFCVFVHTQTHKHTNTQTHKHTNTHKRTPIFVWVGRKNAKSPGQAPELLCLCVCVFVHTQTHKHTNTHKRTPISRTSC